MRKSDTKVPLEKSKNEAVFFLEQLLPNAACDIIASKELLRIVEK